MSQYYKHIILIFSHGASHFVQSKPEVCSASLWWCLQTQHWTVCLSVACWWLAQLLDTWHWMSTGSVGACSASAGVDILLDTQIHCGQGAMFWHKAGGTYSYHWALNG